MNTCTVPVEPDCKICAHHKELAIRAEERRATSLDLFQTYYRQCRALDKGIKRLHRLIARLKKKLAAATPQDESTDHLAVLDSRERAIIAAAIVLVPFLEMGWDEYDEPEDQALANAACDRLIVAVKSATNAAATQMPESATTWAGDALPEQTSASAAAPKSHLSNGPVGDAPYTIPAVSAEVTNTPAIDAAPPPASSKLPPENTYSNTCVSCGKPFLAVGKRHVTCPNCMQPSKLPLSGRSRPLEAAANVNALRHSLLALVEDDERHYVNALCDQALAAIDLDRQVAEKDAEIAALKSDAQFQLTEKMLEAAANKQRELEAELAELKARK